MTADGFGYERLHALWDLESDAHRNKKMMA